MDAAPEPDTSAADAAAADAAEVLFDAGPPLGTAIELPLLPGRTHSSETVVATDGQHVVVAAIQLDYASACAFPDGMDGYTRRTTVWVSHDRGSSFSPPNDLGLTMGTSDPSLAVDSAGTFWLSTLSGGMGDWTVARSDDHGDSWTVVVADYTGTNDKPWLLVDEVSPALVIADSAGLHRFALDGTFLASQPATMTDSHGVAGYVDSLGAHFLLGNGLVVHWDGVADPVFDGPLLEHGPSANVWTQFAGGLGGGASPVPWQWIVRNWRDDAGAQILLHTRDVPGEGVDRALTETTAVAFLPAAATDEAGRLHVAWYDSTGPRGRLLYTHSETSDLGGAFLAPVEVDQDATPGDRWYPYPSNEQPPGGRRLREYIGLTVNGDRVHIAWTHAPTAPARVWITSFALP